MNNPNKAVTCTESPVWGWFVDGLFWLFDVSLIFGFLTTVCVGIGTFIIIENSKKGYDDSDSDE